MADEAITAAAEAEVVETPAVVEAPAATESATNEVEATTTETGSEAEAEVVEEAKPEGAPEEYTEFTMPEGVALDPELTTEFKTAAKELNLTQDQAQRVADLGAKMRQADALAIVNARAEWVKETTEKFTPADLAIANKAAETYGGEAFVKFLAESGLGNHPIIAGVLVNAGKPLAEDKIVPTGDRTDTPNRTAAEKLFGSKE